MPTISLWYLLILFILIPGRSATAQERFAFLVTGDPQYLAEKSAQPRRLDPYSEVAHQRFQEIIRALPGTTIPATVGRGEVSDNILGVLVTGDLIDSLDKNGGPYPAMQQFEWKRFLADYGLNGKDGRIPFPVYELHGNHDGPQGDTFLIDSIISRNKKRVGLTRVSRNGLHYSWDWGPLHLVNLGIFVGASDARRQDHHYAPRVSLDFLRRDLAAHVSTSGRPVIVSFHLHPNCPEFDWPAEDLAAFWETLSRYNVIGLFHGHTHGSPPSRLQWNGQRFGNDLQNGIDVFNPDDSAAAKTDSRDPSRGAGLRHGFLYVELIDHPGTSKDRFLVRSYATKDNWETHGWQRHWEKSISAPDKP